MARFIHLTRTHVARLAFCVAAATAWLPASGGGDPLVERFLDASDHGECIESVAYRMIRERAAVTTTQIVGSALAALARREQQQRALGCAGDIAAQAIAAGADPAVVLQATAAGL